MIESIKFEVGEKYENMKGVYEVVAIRRDSMDIRWEDGEEISTPIELQQRIIERMAHEKELEAAQAIQKAKKAKASASKKGKQFSGLEENDFKNTVSKTTWRGRGQLGGAVAQRIKPKPFKFNSWAVLRKPEVTWLDVERQKQDDLSSQAKFYARIEPNSLYFGVLVPSPNPSDPKPSDWDEWVVWLKKPENDSWLMKQCVTHGLYLCDLGKQGITSTVEVKADKWVHRTGKKAAPIESVGAFLYQLGKAGNQDFRVEKKVDKAEVINKNKDIADEIAGLFERLMPLYAAAIS